MIDTVIYKRKALAADTSSCIISWITIIIIIILISLPIIIFYPYYKYQEYTAVINDNKITIYYKASDIPFKNDQLIIDGVKYDYEIISINLEPVEIDFVKYYPIVVKIKDSISFSQSILKVTFKGEKTTILKEIKRKVSDIY